MASEKVYCLNVILRVKAARREEFLECIKNNQIGLARFRL